MTLKPHVAAILQAMAEAGRPSLHELSPTDARAGYQVMHADLSKVDLPHVADIDAAGIPLRLYRPAEMGETLPVIVFYHGGGWVIGDLDTHDAPCRMLAEATGFAVVAVDYRLAPEHVFPAAVDDAYAALNWVVENAASLGVNPEKIAVAGDSAGGNLAAVMCLKSRDENGPAIRHQFLIYPVTDAAMDTESYVANGEGYMLSRDTMTWFFGHYKTSADDDNPTLSPLRADSLQDLPPATIITAEYDPLRDEGEAYGEKLRAAGNDTLLEQFPGQVHGFFTMTDIMPEAADAVALGAKRLKADLA